MHAGTPTLRWANGVDSTLMDAAEAAVPHEGPRILAVVDRDGRIVGASASASAHGVRAEDLGSLSIQDRRWALADDRGRRLVPDRCPPARVLATGQPVGPMLLSVELVGLRGDWRWISVEGLPLQAPGSELVGVLLVGRDVTDEPEGRTATARVLRAYRDVTSDDEAGEARFRALAESAADVVFQMAADGTVAWVSPSVRSVLGFRPDEVIGRVARDLVHAEDLERANRERLHAMEQGEGHAPRRLEMRYRTATGEWRWMAALARPMFDDDGRVIGGVTALRDAQADIEHRSELEYLAAHDGLTGLLSREPVVRSLDELLGRATTVARSVAVLYIDVDRFKTVNDAHGHQVGDRVLVQVAHRLTAALREDDLVARLGGDEYLVVLHAAVGESYARSRALDLHTALSRPPEPGLPATTVSLGLALWDGVQDAEQLVDAADQALYRAKASGRDTVSW